jgi:DNA-binding transcriptional ArsR family regulator
LVNLIIKAHRRNYHKEAAVPNKQKFTRIPKTTDLIAAGVPVEAIPTYTCLADHANNRTGECWPSMGRLAQILGKSVRTIQRHLHTLKECGLVEFVERRRYKGRFSTYLYRVVLFVQTTGHGRRMAGRRSIYKRTRPSNNAPQSPPKKDLAEGYWWFFGKQAPPEAQEEHDRQVAQRREQEAKRRVEGYEWFFGIE